MHSATPNLRLIAFTAAFACLCSSSTLMAQPAKTGRHVAFQTTHGTYIHPQGDTEKYVVDAISKVLDTWEVFEEYVNPDGSFSYKSVHNKWLRAEAGHVFDDRSEVKGNEMFRLVEQPGGYFAIKTNYPEGTYLTALPGAVSGYQFAQGEVPFGLYSNRKEVKGFELFKVIVNPIPASERKNIPKSDPADSTSRRDALIKALEKSKLKFSDACEVHLEEFTITNGKIHFRGYVHVQGKEKGIKISQKVTYSGDYDPRDKGSIRSCELQVENHQLIKALFGTYSAISLGDVIDITLLYIGT